MKRETGFLEDFNAASKNECTTKDITFGNATRKDSKQDYAIEVDDWGNRRGSELLESSKRLQMLRLPREAIIDFHAVAFEPDPKLQTNCNDESRLQFLQQLMETTEFQSLHAATQLHPCASEIAATAFAEQFAAQLKDEPTQDENEKEFSNLRAIGKALTQAEDEVELAFETAAAFGMGKGSPGSNDASRIGEIYKRVRSSKVLHSICNLAGRFRRLAQSKQRQKLKNGFDETVGLKTDSDLGRILPQELVALLDPVLEQDVLRRFVERQLWCMEFQGSEPVGKGPIILVLDESGSMAGERNHAAKALALALAWIARQQKRWCVLVAYSGDSGERILPLPVGKWDEELLMDWLEAFIGMGSDLDIPISEMPRIYSELKAPKGKTDLIFVTDAICTIHPKVVKLFKDWKKSVQARLITLVIDSEPGDISAISDEVHQIKALAISETNVGKVLSL